MLHDWIKAVAIALAAGPPIGGLVFGIMLAGAITINNPYRWESASMTVLFSTILSYTVGLPIAAVAIALFLWLRRFIARGTAVLAVACSVTSAALFVGLYSTLLPNAPGHQIAWSDFLLQLAAHGIPSAVAAWVCWRITKPWHRLA